MFVRVYLFWVLLAYVEINTYVHTSIHTCIHTDIHTHIHTYIHTYIRTYIHTYIHTDLLTYMHTYIHAYIHIYVCVYVYNVFRYDNLTYMSPFIMLLSLICFTSTLWLTHCLNRKRSRKRWLFCIFLFYELYNLLRSSSLSTWKMGLLPSSYVVDCVKTARLLSI